jgi:uncharacterized protein (TIGR02271 family)
MASDKEKIQNSEFEEKLREAAGEKPVTNERFSDNRDDQSEVIPVIEERARVDKKVIETGSVYIYKDVHEEEISVDIPFTHEEVDIERVPVNQYADDMPPPVRYEGDKTIIPVLKEVLVVEKKIMVVEELHITKRKIETHNTQQINLRREELKVDREDFRNRPDRS